MPEKKTLRVALAQINTTVGAIEENAALIIEYAALARRQQADIVAFPELTLCGYPPEDLLLRGSFIEDNQLAMRKLAHSIEGITAVVGYAEADAGRVFNSAAVVDDGRIVGSYRKMELPNYGVFDEKRYFSEGDRPFVFEMKGVRTALTICEDLWVTGGRAETEARRAGAELIINMSASPFHAGKAHVREELVSGLATRAGAFVLYVNLVGGQDELVFDGGAIAAEPGGSVFAHSQRFVENLLVVDIDSDDPRLAKRAPRVSAQQPRLSLSSKVTASWAPASHTVAPQMSDIDEILAALIAGTRDYARKNGFKKIVLGLSGGIDSALSACVAVEALGRQNVVCVTMPSEYTSAETLSDAEILASNLGVRLIKIPIGNALDAYGSELKDAFGPGEPGIERENLQARIRGNILMALSNRFGWLVLTTGNKSEVAVGYCTLYGDMAGGFNAIKDVLKTTVYRLSEHINAAAGREIIPRATIERPPTAELKPGQKDEDSLPPYSVLDPILHAYVEDDLSMDEIVEMGHDPAAVADVIRMVDAAEYKRRQSAPGVKITPKAFGRDRRLPITNSYRR
ncbi:MAG: Glutamine-dependent NAD(+) synthetase [bacterium ADurb.Bin236]|nr:MAG: Glutamine-dependent NAD(+) synthetase [bacterium ADurb.Bin236]